MDYDRIITYSRLIANAHQQYPNQFGKTTRKLLNGEQIPYFIHPILAATLILSEPNLPEKIRTQGAIVLLFHDVLEDTTVNLPKDLEPSTRKLIIAMTISKEEKYGFSSFEKERVVLPRASSQIQLLKLYDKVATLYDGALPKERYAAWCDLTEKLAFTVEKKYRKLRVVLLAKSLIDEYRLKLKSL